MRGNPAVVVDTVKLWHSIEAGLSETGWTRKKLAVQLGITTQVLYDIRSAARGEVGRRHRESDLAYQPGAPLLLSICWWLQCDPREFQLVRRAGVAS